jgi:hypothetical protein
MRFRISSNAWRSLALVALLLLGPFCLLTALATFSSVGWQRLLVNWVWQILPSYAPQLTP